MSANQRHNPGHGELLAELRTAAETQAAREAADLHARHALEQHMGRQLRRVFSYLSEFSRHLDTLRASIASTYRLSANATLSGLRWQESFIDYRTESSSELAPINSVTFRYTLGAPGQVTVFKVVSQKPRYQEELASLGLRFLTHDRRDLHGLVEETAFNIQREIRVWMRFTPDFASGDICLDTRNFRGLGPAPYRFPADAVDTPLLEQLGLHILGRPNRLFDHLTADLGRPLP